MDGTVALWSEFLQRRCTSRNDTYHSLSYVNIVDWICYLLKNIEFEIKYMIFSQVLKTIMHTIFAFLQIKV